MSVLSVLAEATQYIGSEQYATCSLFFPLPSFLCGLLKVHDDDSGYITRFKTASLNDFTRRFEGIDVIPTLLMAVTLDPRYKKLTCLAREKHAKQCGLLC